jgi:hypothetical protein
MLLPDVIFLSSFYFRLFRNFPILNPISRVSKLWGSKYYDALLGVISHNSIFSEFPVLKFRDFPNTRSDLQPMQIVNAIDAKGNLWRTRGDKDGDGRSCRAHQQKEKRRA